jgi:hypothetical protein
MASLVVIVLTGAYALAADSIPKGKEVAGTIAALLEKSQIKEGAVRGMWQPEPFFTGPATTGMVCAYEWMDDPVYLQAARLGGEFILWLGDSTGHLLGDEAYALLRLSELSGEPQDNRWRVALTSFYDSLHLQKEGATAEYISLLRQGDPSTSVFYVAHHTVVAYGIEDADKEVWRDALIHCLASVDDTSDYPVQALGVAVWALAKTGDLGDTMIDPPETGSRWSGVTLKDLPALLLSHQVPAGEPFAGSFYWRFDHTAQGGADILAAGWTEDAVYGTLGLLASVEGREDELAGELESAIDSAYAALLPGADPEGNVHEHLSGAGASYHAFAGELLLALWSVQQHLDVQMESGLIDANDGGEATE